ncbi:MAG: ABC transporter permease [Treponema sp.]
MNFLLAWKLALRYLGLNAGKSVSNARKSLIGAIWGIGISIIPLVIVLVVADGMIKGISSRMIELGSGHIQVLDLRPVPTTQASAQERRESAAAAFENIRTRTQTLTSGTRVHIEGTGLLIGKKGRSGGTVRAVEPGYFTGNPPAAALLTVQDGSISLDDSQAILLGKKIAEETGLSVGDSCSLLTLLPGYSSQRTVPRITRFKVAGILSSGYQELDALWIFIPLDTGRKILPPQSSLNALVISIDDPFDEAALLKTKTAVSRLLPAGFSLYTWQDLNRAQFYSFQTSKNMLLFIMFLILLAASVNVSSAMVMLIMERRKEIAILKAGGAHPFFITLSFLIAGLLTGTAGLCIGLTAGILAALHINELFVFFEHGINTLRSLVYYAAGQTGTPHHIHLLAPEYYLEYIPIALNGGELYVIAAGTLILSIIVCMLPAVYAGKEKPLESMRKL